MASSGHVPLAPRVVHGPVGWTSLVLVQTIASPLAGDEVEIDVEVEPGARLALAANGATLAYPHGVPAAITMRCRVGRGGRLSWLAQPLILAAGCDLSSRLELELEEGAVALVRETVVLGRHGESPGRFVGTTRADLDGVPLLRDEVRIGPGRATTIDIGAARAVGTVALLGARLDAAPGDDELELHGPGRLVRALGPDAVSIAARVERAEQELTVGLS